MDNPWYYPETIFRATSRIRGSLIISPLIILGGQHALLSKPFLLHFLAFYTLHVTALEKNKKQKKKLQMYYVLWGKPNEHTHSCV